MTIYATVAQEESVSKSRITRWGLVSGFKSGTSKLANRVCYGYKQDKDGNLIKPWTKPYPGWWPCYDYKDLMEMIGGIIQKRKPDIEIVFWSYNWNRAPVEHRKALIDSLPKYITVQATFEMGEYVIRDGVKNRTTDYTIFSHGPGYYFCTEARFAKENGSRQCFWARYTVAV